MDIKLTLVAYFRKATRTFAPTTKPSSVFKYMYSDNLAFGIKQLAGFRNDFTSEHWTQVLPFVFVKNRK